MRVLGRLAGQCHPADQLCPFQWSAWFPLPSDPTAQQLADEVQETALSTGCSPVPGLGTGT
jgi:hypothetical protein